ncbi:DUF305 domain-containing protein [Sanguibacter antarcticus]|uniref:Uncharacterized protein (DUF305 family) n=1 Tax=Sanguibacter antarcticus TaxID=372484 RepID=A0A2A9E6D9_9MICO|nr:DUF305 domain-containing protein [Sanguibacter antarcticus]PFG33769.1 uncharacterized protein (DUF305 family) [Sanguibacter antarcticus]
MTRPSSSRRGFLIAGAVGALGFAGGAAVQAGASSDSAAEEAEETSPSDTDAGFCADMTLHHVQALALCQRVLGRDTGDPVQAAAAEVLQNQAIEVGMMRAWLADWGLSTAAPTTTMAWMGMGAGMPAATMPGLATAEELSALSAATGVDQGRMWIELMRVHHVGGVSMAEAATELVSLDKVRRLASIQVKVQTFEIRQYDELLATVYT